MKRRSSIIFGLLCLVPMMAANVSTEEYLVRIRPQSSNDYVDQMYLSASTQAKDEYQVGTDLIKMKMGTATTAQMWVNAYGYELSVNKAKLVDYEATFPLTISAPAEGDYVLYLGNTITDGSAMYLYKGKIPMGTLNTGELYLHLSSGDTKTYSLKIVAPKQWVTIRWDLQLNDMGTICFPKGICDYKGASFYVVDSINTDKTFVNALKTTKLDPGMPYLFKATSDSIQVVWSFEEEAVSPKSNNGLIGSYDGMITGSGYYVLVDNQFTLLKNTPTIPANSAVLDINAVPTFGTSSTASRLDIPVIQPFTPDPGNLEICHIGDELQLKNNPFETNIVVKNEVGEVVVNQEPVRTPQFISLADLPKGRYTVEFNDGKDVFVISVKPDVKPAK